MSEHDEKAWAGSSNGFNGTYTLDDTLDFGDLSLVRDRNRYYSVDEDDWKTDDDEEEDDDFYSPWSRWLTRPSER